MLRSSSKRPALDGVTMVVHHSATSVTMEVDPPRNADSPDDPKMANGSSETEKGEDSESSEDGPLDVGEHYLVRRYDDSWREYDSSTFGFFYNGTNLVSSLRSVRRNR